MMGTDALGAPSPDAAALAGPLFAALPVPLVIWRADRDAGALIANPAFLAAFGSPENAGADGADLARLIAQAPLDPATPLDVRLKRRNGVIADLRLHVATPPNEGGSEGDGQGGRIAVFSDVSEIRRGLDEATAKLEEVHRAARLGTWEYAITTGDLAWTAECFAVCGQDPQRFQPSFEGWLGILHADDRAAFGTVLERVLADPQRAYAEFRVLGADGLQRAVSITCAPRLDATGRLTHVFGVMLDTTARAEATAELAAAKLRLEEAYHAGHLGYWEYAIHDGRLELNDEAFAIFGRDRDDFEPSFEAWMAILHPDDRPHFGTMLESVIGDSKRVYVEFRVIDPIGDVRTVSSSCAPRFDTGGRLTHVFGILLDTTERARTAALLREAKEEAERALAELRDAQDSLVQSEKMTSLGQLVAGVAHEINGPVGVTLTAATHLSGRTDDFRRLLKNGGVTRSALNDYLDTAFEATQLLVANTERMASLVQTFKQVAADQADDERRVFYLRDYIEDVLLSLHTQIGPSGHRVSVAGVEALQIESYPGAFARILTHFVRNALQHAFRPHQRGHITISAHADGPMIELRHADDGQGIPEADLPKVFDPFFTTKRGERCVGLGLHIAYNLTTQTLGGHLWVESRPGEGATFILRLPRVAPDPGERVEW